jgi:hypothetical protein
MRDVDVSHELESRIPRVSGSMCGVPIKEEEMGQGFVVLIVMTLEAGIATPH